MAKNKKIETVIEVKYNDTGMKKFKEDLKDIKNQTQGTDGAVQIWTMDLNKLNDTLNEINATLKKVNKNKPKPPIPETNKFTEALLTLKKMAQGLLALEVVKWFYRMGKAAIKASSDMEELDNVTTQVFEHLKNEVDVWAKTMANAVGRSTYQITKQTTDMGNILKGFGDYFSVDEISKMSKNLSVLATDMASFLNIEDERATQSITAALTGEAESLKRLGFNLQDVTIKEYALAKGIKKKYEEMSAAEKVQLRYEKLLEITKHVQGDAARTIDNYANQVKSLEANWNNFLTTIGSKLKPSTKAFVSFTSQLLNATNEFLNHKDALTIVGEYKAQEISIDNLVRKWQALENELKTLSQTSEKYKTKLNEQKIIEGKLIEISPSFINVFKDKATAVKKIGDAAQYAKNQLNNLLLKELEQEIVLKPAMKRMLKYTKIVKEQIEDDALINKTTEVLKTQHGIDPKTFFEKHSFRDLVQNEYLVSKGARILLLNYIQAYNRRIKKEFEKDKKLKANEKANEKDNKVFEEIKRAQNIKEIEEINPIVEKVNKNNNLLSKEAKESTKKIKTYWESFKEKLENEFVEYEKALGLLDTKSFNNNKQTITKYINSLYESKKKINEFLFEKEVIKEDELLKENEKALTSKIEALKQVYQKSKDDKDRLILTTTQGELEALKVQKIELEHRNKLKELDNLSLNNLITEEEYKRKTIEVDKNKVQKLIEINELSLAAQTNFELLKKELENYLKKVANKEDNLQQNELLQGLADAFNLNSLKKINELHFKFLKEKDEALKKVYEVYKGNLGYTADYSKLSSNDKKEFETKFIQSGANSKEYQSAISRINNNTQKELVGAYSNLAKEIAGNLTKMIGGVGRALADVTGDKDIIALADGIGEAVGNITAIGAGAARLAAGDIAGGVKDVVQGGIGAISQLAKFIISITKEGQAKLEKEAKEKFLKRENELIENTKTLKELKNTMRELINSNLILASKNTSNVNIEKEKRKIDIINGAYSKTFDPKLIANTVEVKRGRLFNLKWGAETIEHSINLKEFLKKLNPGKELNFGSNSKELLDFYEKNIGSLTEKDLKVLQKNKDGVFNWETESVNSNLEELKTEFLKHIDNVREFENNIKEFEKKAIFESLEGVSHLDKEKEKKEMLDNIKKFIDNDAEYYKLLPEYEKKIDELLSINKPIVTALNETREAFITNLSQGKDILSGFGNSLLGYFNLIRKNIAKIKYDLEFRNFGDFEKNFNERFLQLSQALVKLRTEKGKTLKDLDPKELDFSDIFKQIKVIKDSSNDMQDIIKELREQAKNQGLSTELIDQMLPLDKISDKVNKISTMLANAMNLAIDTNSFNQFSMSIGDSLYKTVKENLIKAFSESAKFKELYEKFINTEGYNSAFNEAKTLTDAYKILTNKLKEFEIQLKNEGLGFRETNASTGEYLGGFVNKEINNLKGSHLSGASFEVNLTNNINNYGYISVEDLANDLIDKTINRLNEINKREV